MYIIGLDIGTTGVRAIAFDQQGKLAYSFYQPLALSFPKPGFIEQDPIEILNKTGFVLKAIIKQVGHKNVVGMGITNQRETTIVWDEAGKPVYPAISWQCRRTADRCADLSFFSEKVKQKTGLPLDPYFSATKLEWILNQMSSSQNLKFGTVDTWILWHLTGQHLTDVSNVSRTMLFNIDTLDYDDELLSLFSIPRQLLPTVVPSQGRIAETKNFEFRLPIFSVIGDQQAALFAQCADNTEWIKNTYGTGIFLMSCCGKTRPQHVKNLITTIAWKTDEVMYAVEGSMFAGGSTLQWLKEDLGLIETVEESDKLSSQLTNTAGVFFIPALAGLGAPYWNPNATGAWYGMTRSTSKAHLVRSVLESLAYQSKAVIEALPQASFKALKVDGGVTKNNFLMQFQADILNLEVHRSSQLEATAFGAAALAALYSGFWTSSTLNREIETIFKPRPIDHGYASWSSYMKQYEMAL